MMFSYKDRLSFLALRPETVNAQQIKDLADRYSYTISRVWSDYKQELLKSD